MDGIVEVITVMLALGGFDVVEDPHPPTAAAVLTYAVPEADAMIYVDAAAILPGNYDTAIDLAESDALAADADLRDRARRFSATVEGAVGLARTGLGVDLVHDVTSVTAFFEHGTGNRLVVIRGDLPATLVTELAKLLDGDDDQVDGRTTLAIDGVLVGTGEDGALLVGTPAWVAPRLDDDWKPAKRKKRGPWNRIAAQLDDAPVALVAAMPDADAADAVASDLDLPLVGDLVRGVSLAILAVRTDGLSLVWKARNKSALRQAALAIDGGVELLRAAAIAPRGLARLGLAALAGKQGDDAAIDAVLDHQDALLALIDDASGDGAFDVVTKRDDTSRTVTVRATGKELADVVPSALVIPAFAAALLQGD